MLIRLPRLLCNINVRVGVNVNTNISISHAKSKAPNISMSSTTAATTIAATAAAPASIAFKQNRAKMHKHQSNLREPVQQQQHQYQHQQSEQQQQLIAPQPFNSKRPRQLNSSMERNSPKMQQQPAPNNIQLSKYQQPSILHKVGNKSGNVPLILIINSLALLLLSFCCGVCKSNEHLISTIVIAGNGSIVDKVFPLHNDNSQQHLIVANNEKGGDGNGDGDGAGGDGEKENQNINNTINKYNSSDFANDKGDATIALVTVACQQQCILEENLFQDEFGMIRADGDLSEKFYRTRCNNGCEQWWRALKEFEPCEEACSSSPFYPHDLPCISACKMAQRHYWHLQRLTMEPIIGASLPPQLFNEHHDDINSDESQQEQQQLSGEEEHRSEEGAVARNNLRLKWSIALPNNYLASRPFNIQYQYAASVKGSNGTDGGMDKWEAVEEQLDPNEEQWFNLADYDCNENLDCEILDGLMPYTTYRFRFELPFGDSEDEILYSPITAVYKTPASGAPISEPRIQSAFALDHGHVAVFWQPGQFTNGPLKGYKIILRNAATNLTLTQTLPGHMSQHTFAHLSPSTNYSIQIAMLNEEGEGPFTSLHVLTRNIPPAPNVSDEPVLTYLITDSNFSVKSMEPNASVRELYKSIAPISDYAVNLWTNQVFVLDVKGTLISFMLPNSTEVHSIRLNILDGFVAQKISLDWLNQRLYIAGKAPSDFWSVVSTDLEGNYPLYLVGDLTEPIQQLEVDPVNGWVFWTTVWGNLARLNLASKEFEILRHATQIGYFVNIYERYLLLAYNKTDGQYYELTYDGLYEGSLQVNSSRWLQGEVLNFAIFGEQLMATNGTHVLQQSYESKTQPVEIWSLEGSGCCIRILPLPRDRWSDMQPVPKPSDRQPPTHLQALLTANMAQVSWQPPARNQMQSAEAWQQWEYELEIMDVTSNSAFQIRNIQSTHFKVEKLQANNLYKWRVRATAASRRLGAGKAGGRSTRNTAAAELAGGWSESLLTRSWPLGDHKLLWSTALGLFETNELGAQAQHLADGVLPPLLRDFVQLNGSIYYVHPADGMLRCANIMNPELNCSFEASHARSVSYDWRGSRLYWVDVQRNCVLRARLDGSQRELLPIHDAQQLQLDTQHGYLYYSTGKRLLRRALSGSMSVVAVEQEYYHGNGGVIRGFALDLSQQQLYWVVRQPEGRVRLFRCGLDFSGSVPNMEDKLLPEDIVSGSLQYVPQTESLWWLQRRSKKLVQLRAAELQYQAVLQPTELPEVSAVRVRAEYTPYADESVVPETVDAATVRIDDGYWDDFNIKWVSSDTADNFTVFYKVLLLHVGEAAEPQLCSREVSESYARVTEFHQPQLLIDVYITPHTYWRAGVTTHVQLRTPAAAPAQPKRMRIFVQRTEAPLQLAANISALIRWDPPENMSLSAAVSYKVYCWRGEELYAEHFHNYTKGRERDLEAWVNGLNEDETYTFQVQAFAVGRANGGEKTAYHALHVQPDAPSVPRLLYTMGGYIGEMDLDLRRQRSMLHTSSEIEHLAYIGAEQRILWVNENVELISFVPHGPAVKLARMRAEVLALTVDWIMRVVYWAELNIGQGRSVSVFKLDLGQFEGRVMLGTKLFSTENGQLLRDLVVLPFSQALIWLEYPVLGEEQQGATVVGRNLSDGSALQFNLGNMSVWRLLEATGPSEHDVVTLIDMEGKMCDYDLQRQLCNGLKQPHFNAVNVPSMHLESDASYFYTLHNDTLRAYSHRKQSLEYEWELPQRVRNMRAYHTQSYPPAKCLIPTEQKQLTLLQPELLEVEENFVRMLLPLINSDAECWLPLAGVRYQLTLTDSTNKTRFYSSYKREFNLTHLEPYKHYTLGIGVTSYYQQQMEQDVAVYRDFELRTSVGTPWLPQNFSASALSPTEILVNWTAPLRLNCEKVWYELNWQLTNSTISGRQTLEEAVPFTINDLLPSATYHIWLKVFSMNNKFNTTQLANVTTYNEPNPLELLERSPYNLTLSWLPAKNVTSAILVCHALNGEDEFSFDITHNLTDIVVTDLEPKTRYEFYLKITFDKVSTPYSWPAMFNERFVFETLGDIPGAPSKPLIEHITGQIFKVFWTTPRDNGAPIVEYSLEALQAHLNSKRIRRDLEAVQNNTISFLSQLPWAEEPFALEDQWIIYCNTTELSCIVRDMHTLRLMMFRVRARNEPYGWGPYSEESERVYEPFVLPEKRDSLVFAIIAPAAIVSSCVILLMVLRKIQARRLKAKKLLEKGRPSIWSNLSTLQQQQLMAGRTRGFSVTSSSTMHGPPLSDADIALLPQINWNQLTILNFLGSGAFGEVYEGLIKYEDGDESEKVAIKTLRKGASEFAELLQEAQLMSNFKHENIVRLIGICFDTESISIVMEHMEGGDLLSYLRESRPNANKPVASLQLLDLLTMCIDVATGCTYLEDMHFVHRDLACRNCLVSSRQPSKRVVKIGDFGLARDIYKNDYYRKEGEGLLPVRWMSPESLMDGVFTSQSDVWAFGVLCWEILTLGQQPYAGRNNFDVLSYVKEGGRLEQPDNCPDKLYALMLDCWNEDPEQRPSFRKCRSVLIGVKTDVRRTSLGSSLDDGDMPIYANDNGVLLSSFLATPLPCVTEEIDVSADVTNEQTDTKVRFEADSKEADYDTASDHSQLITAKKPQQQDDVKDDAPTFYDNEAVSRL